MIILSKLSFDKGLFKKELEKSLKYLEPEEICKLRDWVERKYQMCYSDVINEIFYLQEDIA